MDSIQFMHKFYVDAGKVRRILLARNYLEAGIITMFSNMSGKQIEPAKHTFISERGFVRDREDGLRKLGEHVVSTERLIELVQEYFPPQGTNQ